MEEGQKITGIVAEFNPFHNGHKYLLSQAEGIKIVIMSGNWLQRGEPAVVDKWSRANMALENGADLVIEMPVLASVQAADFFAKGAIDILKSLKINNLVFGTESDLDYQKVSDIYKTKSEEMEDFLQTLPEDLSYPEKTQLMWQKYTGLSFDGNTPNHILALAYIKALKGYEATLSPVRRLGQGFHSKELTGDFASATAIRDSIDQPERYFNFVPSSVADTLKDSPKVSWTNFFPLLKYKIISSDISNILQMNKEFEVRIKRTIGKVNSVDELVEEVYTKRYTKARIKRLLVYILLDIKEGAGIVSSNKIRVLGFTEAGQKHLKSIKKDVELVAKIGSIPWDEESQKADEIYMLADTNIQEQNFGRIPCKYKKAPIDK